VKNVFLLARKDFIRKWRNPLILIGFILIPLIFTLIFSLIFGTKEESTVPRISVLAVDKDKSIASNLFLGFFKQGELNKLIDLKTVEEEKGQELMAKGKASAMIVIPEKFGKNILDREPVEILLLKNPSEQFLPQVVEEVCDISSLLLSSILNVFSEEINTVKGFIEKERLKDEEISSLSIKVKTRIEDVSKFVFPPIITLKQKTIEKKTKKRSYLSIQEYVLPAIAVMFLLFICNVVFEDILREKESGTLLRMTVSHLKISELVWSKILTSAIIGTICTFILVVLGRIIFSVRWGNTLVVIVIVLSLNILIAGFISFLYSFVRTERQAGALLSTVIIIMSLFGGSMMPADFFPPFILRFSKLTVNYWGIKAFHKNITRDSFQELLPILLGMLLAGILFSILGSFFLNKTLKKGLVK